MSGLKIGSLFSGVGGLDLAVEAFFDAETVWHAEFDEAPSRVLAAHWPGVPNHGDVTKVDWSSVEPVDILCGGFPCQDLSLAGRRSGMRPGTRSSLWADFKTAIDVLRPSVIVIENVRGLLSGCAESDSDVEPCPGCVGEGEHRPLVRALGRVLGDLAVLGFDAEWGALEASSVGAPHGRFRVFVVAYAQSVGFERGWPARGRRTGSEVSRGGAPVALLGTPTTRDWKDGSEVANVDVNGLLGRQVWSLLPTPVAQPSGNTPENHLRKKPGRGVVTDLSIIVENDLLTTGGRLLPTPAVADATGGHASRSGDRGDELLLPGVARAAQSGALLPTPRASRGATSTETMYALGAERDDAGDRQGNVTGEVEWGPYAPAIHRWETVLGRPAPSPTRPDGKNGAHRLSAEFCSWMMGYPDGWVTDILDRNPTIKACGNGVVPQQAYAALTELWPRVLESLAVVS